MSAARLLPALFALALVGFQDGDGKKKVVPIERGQLKVSGPVLFETGSDVLKPESNEVLGEVRDTLEARADYTLLRIEGHSDDDGASDKNHHLVFERTSISTRCRMSAAISYPSMSGICTSSSTSATSWRNKQRKASAAEVA